MLEKSFLHFKNIGTKREKELWKAGIYSWDEVSLYKKNQLDLFKDYHNIIKDYVTALNNKDATFFAKRLAKREHYRIAISFPDDVMFLDIETTGLSRVYDQITLIGWSINNNYKTLIKGNDPKEFFEDIKKAKSIITFNGSVFDLPFILEEYPKIKIPQTHIDLRFFCKRVGYSGGQKKIEKEVGLSRSTSISDVKGETAPLLWYRYRYGDLSALKSLIEYNHADIEGMKKIFDVALQKLWEIEDVPKDARTNISFTTRKSKIIWSSKKELEEQGIFISPYLGNVGPDISLSELLSRINLKEFSVVGIDLTGSEDRASGWCYLQTDHVITKRLTTDKDLIDLTLESNPHLISIDSPLSLPEGRISVFDDDPGREQFGIMRRCERILKKRGINVYPSLIPSMQKLTARGIRLASYFRSKGIPVIESYPGAAQDIMDIPRKGASIELLAYGLKKFGVNGSYYKDNVSHDELDAITSAIVGVFFWSGHFEGLGDSIEEYLIIPDLEQSFSVWNEHVVIGLSGHIYAGKTTSARYIEQKGFSYGRYSQVLKKLLIDKNKEVNRNNLQELGLHVNQDKGQRWLGYKLCELVNSNKYIIIDGLRHPEDHAFLTEKYGPSFYHFHIKAHDHIRKNRYINDGNSLNDFEIADRHEVEGNTSSLEYLANKVIDNNNVLSFLQKNLDNIIHNLVNEE